MHDHDETSLILMFNITEAFVAFSYILACNLSKTLNININSTVNNKIYNNKNNSRTGFWFNFRRQTK